MLRIDRIEISLDRAATGPGSPPRSLWLGTITSGVTHLAGGLLLGAVWGSSLAELVPPPHGTNAIQLTATPLIAVDATFDDSPEPAHQVAAIGIAPAEPPTHSPRPSTPRRLTFDGEMPPVSFSAEMPELTATAVSDTEEPSMRLEATPQTREATDKSPDLEGAASQTFKKAHRPQPPVAPSTAAAPTPSSVRQQGQDVESPAKIYSPAPVYPVEALREGVTGRVVLRVRVDVKGTVFAASVLSTSGHAILDEAALVGVRAWRFQPAMRLGVAVEKEIAVPITFRIVE